MSSQPVDLNPQAKQMADPSIVATLAAQANAIWPQECGLVARYELPERPRILDAGCGTGEAAHRLSLQFPQAQVLGVDVVESSLALARSRFSALAPRLAFEHRSVFDLQLPPQSFDLTVCRHVLHSIPRPERAIAELVKMTRPGGYLHLIVEDYEMLHFEGGEPDVQKFWRVVCERFKVAMQTDMRVGRNAFHALSAAGLERIVMDYIVVDTIRVPRETFAGIFEGWRDGFAELIAQIVAMPLRDVIRHFDAMIEQARDPTRYAVWMVPVASARVPGRII
jgi:ubiquinone/menaquinone biosynthesis C-methylase UbiE